MAGGSLIFLGFVVVMFLAIVWAYYTRKGSDITERPSDGGLDDSGGQAPGAEGSSRIAGKVEGEQDRFDTHGTA